jgi:hypothetical protein
VLGSLFSFTIKAGQFAADTATMTMLGDQRNMYGRVRVGGAPAGVMCRWPVVIQQYGLNWAFWSYAALMFIGFLVSQRFVFGHVMYRVSWVWSARIVFEPAAGAVPGITFVCGMADEYQHLSGRLHGRFRHTFNDWSGAGAGHCFRISHVVFCRPVDRALKPHGLLIFSMIATLVRLFLYATVVSEFGW